MDRKVLVVLLLLIVGAVFQLLRHSLFFTAPERLNIVMYGEKTVFYSLGIRDRLDYAIPFYPDLRITVPGGYGEYRIGGLGKLVSLEKNDTILKKTFSTTTATFVSYYFLPRDTKVYYGKTLEEVSVPSPFSYFTYRSNAGFFDRVYIFFHMIGKRPQNFTNLTTIKSYVKAGDIIFSQDDFNELYKGYFYQKRYRDERKNIQILYSTEYRSASSIGQLLEGNGIRVSDISEGGKEGDCVVKEQAGTHSVTARDVATFFGCRLEQAQTGVYDILFVLGSLEKSWE